MERVAIFEIVEPGLLTTVQDLGRFGFSRFGVPPSGALDRFSLRVGNLLVGNEESEAGLETTIMGLKLKALRKVFIAITGGDLSPLLNNEEPLEMWKTHVLKEGDLLSFRALRSGCRAYVAVQGGIDVPLIMKSKATCLSAKFGGFEGRALKKGDILFGRGTRVSCDRTELRFPPEWVPPFVKEATLRVVLGPQDDHFTTEGLRTFQSSPYRVTPHSDRMGIRLDGPKIERRPDVEDSIISESLIPGNIQVPGDGRPLIILNESVTGGYTKIATIISVDLPKAAQLKPGDRVQFEAVSLAEAHRLLRDQEDRLRKFKAFLGR